MSRSEKLAQLHRERGKSLVRAAHLGEIQAAGAARELALHEADEQLDRIARRLPEALAAGLTISEIARSAGVSRQTLYELKGRYGSVGDVRLAVLQSVALHWPAFTDEIAAALGRPHDEIESILYAYVCDELVEPDLTVERSSVTDEREFAWDLTSAGRDALEQWTSEVEADLK